MPDPTWNFMDVASKDRLLGVLQQEIDHTFDLVADPDRWTAPTPVLWQQATREPLSQALN